MQQINTCVFYPAVKPGVPIIMNGFQCITGHPVICDRKVKLAEIPQLKFDLKLLEYSTEKYAVIPIDKKATNGGRFQTVSEAVNYLCEHCKKYHGSFTRGLAKVYSQFVQVLALADGGYIPLSEIDKKVFNHHFNKTTKQKET